MNGALCFSWTCHVPEQPSRFYRRPICRDPSTSTWWFERLLRRFPWIVRSTEGRSVTFLWWVSLHWGWKERNRKIPTEGEIIKRSDRYLKGNCALAEGVCVCVCCRKRFARCKSWRGRLKGSKPRELANRTTSPDQQDHQVWENNVIPGNSTKTKKDVKVTTEGREEKS